ncbi:uncharacterized protein il11a [Amia ocellicauda]|uniref:uncharacterized protein il11a n=1 Tax=Amia ocellicauda TaxID=2972642 RepID=UPI003463CAA5
MKLVADASPSILLSLLLAQLPAFIGCFPAKARFHGDFDKLTNQMQHLLRQTKTLLKDHAIDVSVEPRFQSLPVVTNTASDLTALQVKPTLTQILSDMQVYERHFDWLTQLLRRQGQAHPVKLGDVHHTLKAVNSALIRQMVKLDMSRPVSPSLSPLPSSPLPWELVQISREFLQQLRLYSDWSFRALLALKAKI